MAPDSRPICPPGVECEWWHQTCDISSSLAYVVHALIPIIMSYDIIQNSDFIELSYCRVLMMSEFYRRFTTWCQRWDGWFPSPWTPLLTRQPCWQLAEMEATLQTVHDRFREEWEKWQSKNTHVPTHLAGPDALKVYNTFSFESLGDEKKLQKVLDKFDAHCIPRKNVTCSAHELNSLGKLYRPVRDRPQEQGQDLRILSLQPGIKTNPHSKTV